VAQIAVTMASQIRNALRYFDMDLPAGRGAEAFIRACDVPEPASSGGLPQRLDEHVRQLVELSALFGP
jgi:hypothetical protein